MKIAIIVSAIAFASANFANAATVTFDDGSGCIGADYTITQGSPEAACTFSTANGFFTVNTTDGLVGSGSTANSFWTVRFSQLMSQVGIDLGDFGVDSESVFLAAYDASNQLLSTQTVFLGTSNVMTSLSLDFGSNAISWATFGTTAAGIYADNFSYDRIQVAPVPLPASGGLMLGMLGLLGLARRRRG